jgi:DNA-binding NarL/FixJ family response regulator
MMASPKRPDTSAIRVCVADATLMACALVADQLKKQFDVVGHATTRAGLLEVINKSDPEIALIGCDLKDGSRTGLSMLPEAQVKFPQLRIIVLIDSSDPETVVEAFRLSAVGVFDRSEFHFRGLYKCIVSVHQGQIWANTQQLKFILGALSQAPNPRVADADGMSLLTKREDDLVRLVADGLGNREIARKLNLSEHTIKNYMFNIFDKLGISNRVELVLYALNNTKRTTTTPSATLGSGTNSG